MELTDANMQVKTLDHHGIVAAICKDLKISDKIDCRVRGGRKDRRRIVSCGEAVIAMILNGLGFTNRRLYLTPQFFENKPVDRLIAPHIEAKHLDDHSLGKALDEIAEYGASRLFGEVGFEVALEHGILGDMNRLDTTSLSVEGVYDLAEEESSGLQVTHGYSKDRRPDLKQVVLSLVVNGPADLPVWCEGLDGNSSDKKSMPQTAARVESFRKQLGLGKGSWVADAAFYSEKWLLKQSDYIWISRVPESITEAKQLVCKDSEEITWEVLDKGYRVCGFDSGYGGVKQRWLLVHSEQAETREKKTFERRLTREEEALTKALWHLGKQVFQCEEDAKKAFAPILKKNIYHAVTHKILPIEKHKGRGKPKANAVLERVGFRIEASAVRDAGKVKKEMEIKGRFILATNQLDKGLLTDRKMLEEYKGQQGVERGFRFLKDPWFMVDSIFLKSRKRIEALMMVMALCLMVYNFGQYRLRKTLKGQNETVPNQLNKAVQNPTLRWIFQMMEGINVVQFFADNVIKPIKQIVANINALRKKIIGLFGGTATEIYGIT